MFQTELFHEQKAGDLMKAWLKVLLITSILLIGQGILLRHGALGIGLPRASGIPMFTIWLILAAQYLSIGVGVLGIIAWKTQRLMKVCLVFGAILSIKYLYLTAVAIFGTIPSIISVLADPYDSTVMWLPFIWISIICIAHVIVGVLYVLAANKLKQKS